MKTIGIYALYNVVNHKWYIGQSLDLDARRRSHLSSLNRHHHRNLHLQAAFDKYGAEAFCFMMLETLASPALLDQRERHWIALKHSDDPRHGYNAESGGRSDHNPSPTTRCLMSMAQRLRRESEYSRYRTDEPCPAPHQHPIARQQP